MEPFKENKRAPIVEDEAIAIAILRDFATYPMSFLRHIARRTGNSKDSVHKILLKHNFHPYSISLVQQLKDTDPQRRLQFCEFVLTMFQDDWRFLSNIIWSNEGKFTNVLLNRHNSHFLFDSNLERLRNYEETGSLIYNVL